MSAPAPNPTWITLEAAKTYLHFDPADTSDDATLQGTVNAAAAMIEDIKGRIEKGSVTGERHRLTNHLGAVFLDERPVASVDAVRVYRGDGSTVTIPRLDPADSTTLGGYELAGGDEAGVLQLPIFGSYACPLGAYVAVDYSYGLDVVPGNYIEAAKRLVRHLWTSSQENATGGRPGTGDPDTDWMRGSSSSSYALPFEVRELLGIYGSVVKSAGVRVL